jgi:arabinose-5-phosphate isomerase
VTTTASLVTDDASTEQSVECLRSVVSAQARALSELARRIDAGVAEVVAVLLVCRGRIIVSGIGKSGLIARKIAATLCSMGTPALFLHPVEACHGDFGIVGEDDILLALSESGETDELLNCVTWIKHHGLPTVCLTCQPASALSRTCDFVIDVGVRREADPLGVAPMASTTAMAAMGDALAAAIAQRKGFSADQFAQLHPGGALGRRLRWRVADLMHSNDEIPIVSHRADLRACLCEISRKRLGAALVVDDIGRLAGILTDGDLRRLLERVEAPLEMIVGDVMTRPPVHTSAGQLASAALQLMTSRSITILPVLDERGVPVGVLHLHDLLKAGITR